MARKSSLTDRQWAEIERRLLAGEKVRALAREFGVAESTIRTRLSAQAAQIKTVAHQVIAAEEAFKSLPISAQISAQSLINKLRSISHHIAGAAEYGAMTAHRLNGIAHQQIDKLNDSDPLGEDSIAALKSIGVYTEIANKAGSTALNLLAANKDRIAKADEGEHGAPSRGQTTEARRKLLRGVAPTESG